MVVKVAGDCSGESATERNLCKAQLVHAVLKLHPYGQVAAQHAAHSRWGVGAAAVTRWHKARIVVRI